MKYNQSECYICKKPITDDGVNPEITWKFGELVGEEDFVIHMICLRNLIIKLTDSFENESQ